MNLLEARGQYVSEATLKKLFSDGSEDKSFRYQDTILPVADVLLDLFGDRSGLDDADALREIIREKNKTIEILTLALEEQADRIAHLTAQLDRKDALIERLVGQILP